MLRTTGHESREPVNTLVLYLTNSFNFKSLSLNINLFHAFSLSTLFVVSTRHRSSIYSHIPVGSWFNKVGHVVVLTSSFALLIRLTHTTTTLFVLTDVSCAFFAVGWILEPSESLACCVLSVPSELWFRVPIFFCFRMSTFLS